MKPHEDEAGALPPAFSDPGRFPLVYGLMQPMDASTTSVRLAGSTRRRARTSVCNAFYKPVSKCFLRSSPGAEGTGGNAPA